MCEGAGEGGRVIAPVGTWQQSITHPTDPVIAFPESDGTIAESAESAESTDSTDSDGGFFSETGAAIAFYGAFWLAVIALFLAAMYGGGN